MGSVHVSDGMLRNWMRNLLETELASKETFNQQAHSIRMSTDQLVFICKMRRIFFIQYTVFIAYPSQPPIKMLHFFSVCVHQANIFFLVLFSGRFDGIRFFLLNAINEVSSQRQKVNSK